MKTYTKAQFTSYVLGFLGHEQHEADQLTPQAMKAALNNALVSFDCASDSFADYVLRNCPLSNNLNSYRFDGKYVRDLESDDAAFEYAIGFHDDRSATVEKWMNGRWVSAADPLYHPQHFNDGKNGGWMTNNGLVEFNS